MLPSIPYIFLHKKTNTKTAQTGNKSSKNRFLGLFCDAKYIDESWGYNWLFFD